VPRSPRCGPFFRQAHRWARAPGRPLEAEAILLAGRGRAATRRPAGRGPPVVGDCVLRRPAPAGELVALRWEDVDLATGVIRVRRGWRRRAGRQPRGRCLPWRDFGATSPRSDHGRRGAGVRPSGRPRRQAERAAEDLGGRWPSGPPAARGAPHLRKPDVAAGENAEALSTFMGHANIADFPRGGGNRALEPNRLCVLHPARAHSRAGLGLLEPSSTLGTVRTGVSLRPRETRDLGDSLVGPDAFR
jgi:hypothetical protein